MGKNKRKAPQPHARSLVPDQIYRPDEARFFFGYKATQLDEKIKAGEVPAPIPLSDSGRAVGWLGSQIIAWQAGRVACANALVKPRTPILQKANSSRASKRCSDHE